MGKEPSKITRYYDAVPPYCSALKISERKYESDTDKDHDVSYSKEHFELESSNPADTVKVATFLRNKQYKPNEIIKKDHYYVCEFTWQPYRRIKEIKNMDEITYEGSETIETSHYSSGFIGMTILVVGREHLHLLVGMQPHIMRQEIGC